MAAITRTFTDTGAATDTAVRARTQTLDAPPALIGLTALPAVRLAGQIELVAPPDEAVVPTARPQVTARVDTDADGALLQVEFSTDATFASPESVYAEAAVPGGLVDAQITVRAPADLADDTVWWWRARLLNDPDVTAWTEARSFATSLGDGYAYAAGAWRVEPAAVVAAHLWYIDPGSGADTGDYAALVGVGFGTAPQVLYGDRPVTVLGRTAVPAGPDATSEARRIDPPGGRCDVAHERVTFELPAVDADEVGDIIRVVAGSA
jgi:hypothetical protein